MNSISELQEMVRSSTKLHVQGAGTKSALHTYEGEALTISTQSLSGVVSYNPQEFVITLLSGTPVQQVVSLLAEQGQYLPFDPLLVGRGATIGGTIASNMSGPGRFRYGGVRDFLLGVRFIDGHGNCIRGGGQVVKNAAGFDYPKVMVGSQGKLGLIYEATFKVFPRPKTTATILGRFADLDCALQMMNELASSKADIDALDLLPRIGQNANNPTTEFPSAHSGYELAVRIAGLEGAISKRLSRLQQLLQDSRVLTQDEEQAFWSQAVNLDWVPSTSALYKLPITPQVIPRIEERYQETSVPRRYSVGGNVAWIALDWNTEWETQWGERATILSPTRPLPIEGAKVPGPFGQAIRRALDPHTKFV